ncbi:tetratricopeptide repeat protein [Nonomuraea polychroma]|uniref:tetratricopeptide repeat protein n=1 Tax=Nonomuraea polychroma TaxID=46176 RepID=UPI003D8EBB4E
MVTGGSIERARALLELRRPLDAERELRGLLAWEPQHAWAHSYLALALSEQGRAREAVAEACEGVRLTPDDWFAHYTAAQVLHRADQPGQALAAVQASLALHPEHAPTWDLLARLHLRSGRWPQMAEAAHRGLAIDPADSDLVSLLALAMTGLGWREQAKAAAEHAVRLDPENAMAHLAYGQTMLTFGEPHRAAEAFREVLRLNPGLNDARDLLLSALKSRNPVYRVLSRIQERFRGTWLMLLLLPVAPSLIVIFVLIAVLHWAAWVAEAWLTLRLARQQPARLLLRGAETRAALACCWLLAAGAATLLLGAGSGSTAVGIAGAALMALVTPVQEATHTGAAHARSLLYGWAALLGLAGFWSAISASWGVALLSACLALATIWLAPGLRRVLHRPGTAFIA